jgi:hypothetical protein
MSFFSILSGLKKGPSFNAAPVAQLTGTHEQQLRAAYEMGYRDGRLDAAVDAAAAASSKRWPPDPPTPPTSGGCALAAA